MSGHSSYCPEAGQQGGPAGTHDELEARLVWLCSEVRQRVDNLNATVPDSEMKYAASDELRHHKKVTKGLVVSMIKDLEEAVNAYADEEYDPVEMEKVSVLGEGALQDARKWLEDLDSAFRTIRSREILVLDGIRRNVDSFTENDTRCVYEFLKQIASLEGLAQREAAAVLVEELLSPELQQGLPKPVFSTEEVRCHLLEKFGNLTLIIEGWVLELEQAAAT